MQCLLCNQQSEKEALSFWGISICSVCEAKLSQLSPAEVEYDYVVRNFRLLWEKRFPALHHHCPMESD